MQYLFINDEKRILVRSFINKLYKMIEKTKLLVIINILLLIDIYYMDPDINKKKVKKNKVVKELNK